MTTSPRTASLLAKRRDQWTRRGFQNLLVWLLVYLLLGPFLESNTFANLLMTGFLSVVLMSVVLVVNRRSRLFRLHIALMLPTVLLLWLVELRLVHLHGALPKVLVILYLGMVVYFLARHLFALQRVTANAVCAALCLYLVFGVWWGSIFSMLELLVPGSFAGGVLNLASSPQEKADCLQYFSFVTLATLGYGDITPQTRGAAVLCQTEAILGQFFALVLIARLVGIQVAQEGTNKTPGEA